MYEGPLPRPGPRRWFPRLRLHIQIATETMATKTAQPAMIPPMVAPWRLKPSAATPAGGALEAGGCWDSVGVGDSVEDIVVDVVEVVDEVDLDEVELVELVEVDELELVLVLDDEELASAVTRPVTRVICTVVLSPEAVAATLVPWLDEPHPY